MIRQSKTSLSAASIIIVLALFVTCVPLLMVFINSLKSHAEIVRAPMSLTGMGVSNYVNAVKNAGFGRGFLNSFILIFVALIILLFSASLASYAIARRKIRAWKLILLYFLLATTVPIQLFLFPLYFVLASLGLIDNLIAMGFIMAGVQMPLAIFILRSFVFFIPDTIEESASIDGAGPLQIYFQIILPLLRPGIITVATVSGFNIWKDFLLTSTFLQSENVKTVSLKFLSLSGAYTTDYGVLMAGALIVVIPILIFFIFVQRYFIEGIASGSTKG